MKGFDGKDKKIHHESEGIRNEGNYKKKKRRKGNLIYGTKKIPQRLCLRQTLSER